MEKAQLLTIERGFWHEGADYYNAHISEEALFVFPGMRLQKDDGVRAADQAPRWDKLEISDAQLFEFAEGTALLTYHATAQRTGQAPYAGNITTIYRLENGEPRMVFHQQTPDPSD